MSKWSIVLNKLSQKKLEKLSREAQAEFFVEQRLGLMEEAIRSKSKW